MSEIKRIEVDEFWADSTIIQAGDYVFVGYCMGNEGHPIEEQIEGAFSTLENRLSKVGIGLESVVKMDSFFDWFSMNGLMWCSPRLIGLKPISIIFCIHYYQ